jgi:ribonuclease Y
MGTPVLIGAVLGSGLLGFLLSWVLIRARLKSARADAESVAAEIRAAAEKDVERIRKAAELEGKEEAYRAKEEWEREEARRREDIGRAERRMEERRTALDRKYDILDEKDKVLDERERELEQKSARVEQEGREAERLTAAARARLESLAGMTADEARLQLMQQMEEHARAHAANTIREIKENAKRRRARARNIIALAIQRIAADHTARALSPW